MDCLDCPRRPACREICPEVEALLPAVDEGKMRSEALHMAEEENQKVELAFENLKLLTPRQKVVMYLYHRSQLSAREIGRGVGMTREGLYWIVRRIGRKIRQKTSISFLIRRRRSSCRTSHVDTSHVKKSAE